MQDYIRSRYRLQDYHEDVRTAFTSDYERLACLRHFLVWTSHHSRLRGWGIAMIFEEMLVYPLSALFATLGALLLNQRLIRIATEPLVLSVPRSQSLVGFAGFPLFCLLYVSVWNTVQVSASITPQQCYQEIFTSPSKGFVGVRKVASNC